MSLWNNFLSGFDFFPKIMTKVDADVLGTIETILEHAAPYIVVGGLVALGIYGLPTYLAGDFTKSARDKLIAGGQIGNLQEAFWLPFGYKKIEEAEANKIKAKEKGKPSEKTSVVSLFKTIFPPR